MPERPYRSVRVQLIVFISYIIVRKNQEDPVIPASKLADAPRDSPLIYQPARRYEAWRFLSYMFIHHQSVDVSSRIQPLLLVCMQFNDLAKKCMDFEVQDVRPRGRPVKTWIEVTEKDCHTQEICKEDAVDRRK